MTLRRRILVPTLVLAAIVLAAIAYAAWEASRTTRAIDRESRAVRTAAALAFALGDAVSAEERAVVAVRLSPDDLAAARLADAAQRTAALVAALDATSLPPRAAAVWDRFLEAWEVQVGAREEVVEAARRRDARALALALDKWNLIGSRADAHLDDLVGYHVRFLDRTVSELHARWARALETAVLGVLLGLLLALAFAFILARALVRPIAAMADAAQEIAATGRHSAVGGAERRDEVGKLARAFNQMTERLFAANASLSEADRRKDEFLGVLSHELRNPLAPIWNSIHLLQHADPTGPQARHAREVIARQTGHLSRLVDDLLDVTRIARGKIELRRSTVDLCEVVRRAGDDHRALLEARGVALAVHAPVGPVWVDGDATRLAQVIGNLLQNAAKFTARGGTVDLAVSVDATDAAVSVSDTGAGIDPELLGRLFQPFTQGSQSLARTAGGLGLGLALVKGLVELHGGTVTARSEGPGRGATFTVRLPAAAAAPAPTAARSSRPAPSRRRRVLVVDDNRDAAESLAELVGLMGHDAEVAFDGPSALEKARARAPDVVLCDIGLPGMSGYDVARALRSESSDGTLLVAVTGYALPEDRERASEAGFDAHLAKPPDPEELERLLGER